MAKLATINREKKREGLVAKYAKKRADLRQSFLTAKQVKKRMLTHGSNCKHFRVTPIQLACVTAAS